MAAGKAGGITIVIKSKDSTIIVAASKPRDIFKKTKIKGLNLLV